MSTKKSTEDMRRIRAAALLAAFDDETREGIIEATIKGIELLEEVFPGQPKELLADLAEGIGGAISQIGSVPAHALSETIQHSASIYMLGAAVLTGAIELPGQDAKPGGETPAETTTPDLEVSGLGFDGSAAGPYL